MSEATSITVNNGRTHDNDFDNVPVLLSMVFILASYFFYNYNFMLDRDPA